jgi:hypothetical protein
MSLVKASYSGFDRQAAGPGAGAGLRHGPARPAGPGLARAAARRRPRAARPPRPRRRRRAALRRLMTPARAAKVSPTVSLGVSEICRLVDGCGAAACRTRNSGTTAGCWISVPVAPAVLPSAQRLMLARGDLQRCLKQVEGCVHSASAWSRRAWWWQMAVKLPRGSALLTVSYVVAEPSPPTSFPSSLSTPCQEQLEWQHRSCQAGR